MCVSCGRLFDRKRQWFKSWFLKLQGFVAAKNAADIFLNMRHVIMNGLIELMPFLPVLHVPLHFFHEILVSAFGV